MFVGNFGIYAQQTTIPQVSFKMTVDTTVTGGTSSASGTMVLPFFAVTAETFVNCVVDWGDGSTDPVTTGGNLSHTYTGTAPTSIQIEISGKFPAMLFNAVGDKLKLTTVDEWGTNNFKRVSNMFHGCANFTGGFTDAPDLPASGVSAGDLGYMFYGCASFNNDLANWDVSNATTFDRMFAECTVFNGDVTTWDCSNVTNFSFCFWKNTVFNQDLSLWRPSNVTNMTSMFQSCSVFNNAGQIGINDWTTGNVVTFTSMFYGAFDFNQSIESWDTSSANFMNTMFRSATSYDQDMERNGLSS